MKYNQGFTLIELMVAVSIAAVLLTLAAPSFYDFILTQRLKSISAQLTTDLQLARSEAASRNMPVHVRFSEVTAKLTCYTIYTSESFKDCNCTKSPACTAATAREIRTAQVADDLNVKIRARTSPSYFDYNAATGTAMLPASDNLEPAQAFVIDTFIDPARTLRTVIQLSGRPSVCAPAGSTMSVAPCAP